MRGYFTLLFAVITFGTCGQNNYQSGNLHFVTPDKLTPVYKECKMYEDIIERCQNCAGWNMEFRLKNSCYTCNDHRRVITGKKPCSSCNGKGKRLAMTEMVKLSLSQYDVGDKIIFPLKNMPTRVQSISRDTPVNNPTNSDTFIFFKVGLNLWEVVLETEYTDQGYKRIRKSFKEHHSISQLERDFIIQNLYPGFQAASIQDAHRFFIEYSVTDEKNKGNYAWNIRFILNDGKYKFKYDIQRLSIGPFKYKLRELGTIEGLVYITRDFELSDLSSGGCLIVKKRPSLHSQHSNRTLPRSTTDEIEKIMTEMYVQHIFRVFDREGTNYMKKLKIEELETVKSRALSRIRIELGDNLEDIDMSTVDDTFMNYLINYMVVDKKMDPFYIEYIPDPVYKLGNFNEDKGQGKESSREGFSVNTEKVYIQYTDGDNFKIVGGPDGKNAAAVTYNRRTGQPVSGPEEPVRPSGEQPSQNKSSEPEKRPEEEMNVNQKSEKEGVESIMNNLSQQQKRVLQNNTNQDWTTEKPANQDDNVFDVIDLTTEEDSFEMFRTFPMYRPKMMTEQNLESYSELLDAQDVNRAVCKSTVKVFYDAATGKKRLSDNSKIQYADYITACHLQIKNYRDLGVTKKKIEALENKMANNPSYQINYSARTIGGNKF